ncbi:MAG: hypothetical protein AAF532_13205 [Planctomycetota bacterium]
MPGPDQPQAPPDAALWQVHTPAPNGSDKPDVRPMSTAELVAAINADAVDPRAIARRAGRKHAPLPLARFPEFADAVAARRARTADRQTDVSAEVTRLERKRKTATRLAPLTDLAGLLLAIALVLAALAGLLWWQWDTLNQYLPSAARPRPSALANQTPPLPPGRGPG